MRLEIRDLHFCYGSTPVLNGLSAGPIEPGRVTATIGPNAAGKSTLFKCIAGLLRAPAAIHLDGEPADRLSRDGSRARLVSYLPQEYPSTAALTVFEAILLARQTLASWSVRDADLEKVAQTLRALRLEHLSLRYLNELSGGQRQMVAVAQSLAREPRVLLLDEPTSSLDLQRQLELLSLVRALAIEKQMTVLIAVHDLNLAARFADTLLVLDHGQTAAFGPPSEVLTPELLRTVYGIEAHVDLDSTGVPRVTPLRSIYEAHAA